MTDEGKSTEKENHQNIALPGKFALPSLFISNFSVGPSTVVINLLLIDIGQTFGSPVGITGQIQTLSLCVSVVSSLLLGLLSVRYRHKSLLLYGMLIISASVLGCVLANSFTMFLVIYSFLGVGRTIVAPMTMTLVGELFPIEKRTRVIGLIRTGSTLSIVIGAPVVGLIVGFGGWRLPFLAYVLPLSLLGLFLVARGLPSPPLNPSSKEEKVDYLEGFKGVLRSRSALACLLGTVLIMAAFQSIALYSVSFYREVFSVSTAFASTFITFGSLTLGFGSLMANRFVNKLGRKTTAVISGLVTVVFIMIFPTLPELMYSLATRFTATFFSGVMFTSCTSLHMEQVPEHRGAMLSSCSAARSLGGAIGAALGGVVILWVGYRAMGVSLGALGVVSILVYQLLVKETVNMDISNG